jgi:hypothetical protein
MIDTWRWKSSIQPYGGEGLAKRKGVAATRGLKEARSNAAARWTSDVITMNVNGHQNKSIDELLPWSYLAGPALKH